MDTNTIYCPVISANCDGSNKEVPSTISTEFHHHTSSRMLSVWRLVKDSRTKGQWLETRVQCVCSDSRVALLIPSIITILTTTVVVSAALHTHS